MYNYTVLKIQFQRLLIYCDIRGQGDVDDHDDGDGDSDDGDGDDDQDCDELAAR